MKHELNAPIIYNKTHLTYQYKEAGKLCINGWESYSIMVSGDSIVKTKINNIKILSGDQKPQ